MNILSLDLSTNAGYSLIDQRGETIRLITYGNLRSEAGHRQYPWNYIDRANVIAELVHSVCKRAIDIGHKPDVIVIEETNIGKSRYTQKLLEFIHFAVLSRLSAVDSCVATAHVVYINTSDWRKALNVQLSAADKKQNARLSKAKAAAKKAGKKLDKKALGIRGRINKKHVAIRVINALFDLNFTQKDNDLADAICMGVAYAYGVKACDGK